LEIAAQEGILSSRRGRLAKLSFSLYGYDAIIFLNSERNEVRALLSGTNFGEATGLRLNMASARWLP
jgi:hypothetical protein